MTVCLCKQPVTSDIPPNVMKRFQANVGNTKSNKNNDRGRFRQELVEANHCRAGFQGRKWRKCKRINKGMREQRRRIEEQCEEKGKEKRRRGR